MSTSRIIRRNAGKGASLAGENFDNSSERVAKSRSGGNQKRARRDVGEVWDEVQAITRRGLGWVPPANHDGASKKKLRELFEESAEVDVMVEPGSNPTVSA